MHLSLAFSYESAFAALVGGLGIGIFATIYAHTNRSAMPSATPDAHVQPAMLVTSAIASALLASQFFEMYAGGPANRAQQVAYTWISLPVPVIAAVHGVAYGGGLQIALGADVRIVAPDAKLSVMEIKWGLVPDMSITQTLRDILPLDVAKELTFTGRILSGLDAQKIGLVTHVADDPLAAAMELAGEIAAKSPDAVRAGKKLYEDSWHADARTGLEMESTLQTGLIGSENQIEAIKAKGVERPHQRFGKIRHAGLGAWRRR